MAGGLKLFDYRMTEKEYILAETIIEMTDKSELFRTGLEHFDWSEIKVIPTGDLKLYNMQNGNKLLLKFL